MCISLFLVLWFDNHSSFCFKLVNVSTHVSVILYTVCIPSFVLCFREKGWGIYAFLYCIAKRATRFYLAMFISIFLDFIELF